MKNLHREFLKVQNLSEKVGEEFLYNSKHKKNRELWILGSFYDLLKLSDEYCDTWFQDGEKPDFTLATRSLNTCFGVEITQVLHFGRKVGDERKIPFSVAKWMAALKKKSIDPWIMFYETLNKKLQKDYKLPCDLVIYHNIPMLHLSETGFWHNLVCANVRDWIERKIIHFESSKFRNIYVLNSSATELLCIYPKFGVVYSPHEKYFDKNYLKFKWE